MKARNLVWFHENCIDGACAAWVASQYLDDAVTEYVPQNYGKPIKKSLCVEEVGFENVTLYILDWCPESMEKLEECCAKFAAVILIDHHDSAIRKVEEFRAQLRRGNMELRITAYLADRNQWSGAMGTAKWFEMSKLNLGGSYKNFTEHWLVQAVDDRDRWVFALPGSREIHEAIAFRGMNWRDWDIDSANSISQRDTAIEQGKVMLAIQQKHVAAIIAATAQDIEDVNDNPIGMICNCNYQFASEIGNTITNDHKYRVAVLWYIDKEYKVYFSFRSKKENPRAIDCGKLATALGGGGHINAAGAKMALPPQQAFDAMFKALGDVA